MKKPISILSFTSGLAIATLVILATVITAIDVHNSYTNFRLRSADMRQHFIRQQQDMIKHEVDLVTEMISYERSKHPNLSGLELARLQQDLLDRFATIRYGKDDVGYIFVVTYDGTTLMNDTQRHLIGNNIWEMTDPYGVKVIQEERKAVENPAGDYIYYSWLKSSPGDEAAIKPKTSFMKGIPDWQWMIGAGVYLDDVEEDIALLQKRITAQLRKKISTTILAVVCVVTILSALLVVLKRKIHSDFTIFISFFERAALSDEHIDKSRIRFIEFYRLAEFANRMITEKAQTQSELRNSQQKLIQAQRIAQMGDFTFHLDTGCFTCSNNLHQLLDVGTAPLTEDTLIRLLADPSALTSLKQMVSSCIDSRSEQLPPIDLELHGKGEKSIYVHLQGRVQYNGETASTIFGTCQNITIRKQTEEELQQAEKLKSVGTLAAGIAHDFNNVLMGLFGNISLAKEQLPPSSPATEFLINAENALSRASRLTNQLLTFAKGGEPIKENLHIGALIKEITRFDLSGSNVLPVFDIDSHLWMVEADQGQMQQVFSNLAINANEAMPQGGHLFISMCNTELPPSAPADLPPGRYIKITVRDEGCGIPPDQIKRIFDPYYSTKQTGNGLGLATVYSILHKHGGSISVSSPRGQGSTFTLLLPTSATQPFEHAAKTTPPKPAMASPPARILVMDDETMLLTLFKTGLERVGFSVETAETGQEAITRYQQAAATNAPFDLVIMDLTIPGGMGGIETLRNLKHIDPAVCSIVSSGYADDPVMANYADYGFKGVLVKPCSIQKMQETVREVLQKGTNCG